MMDTENVENVEDFSNKAVNFLKTNGKFDEFRQRCASEIEQHTSFVNARKEVEELVRMRVVSNRKSQFPLTKNQLRHEIRVMLSKRKDLLAAADSSIQYSLRRNHDLFATQINEVNTTFEEEEKETMEAKKIELAEKLVQEKQEAEKFAEEQGHEDIPPPPPPPPPPAPRAPTIQKVSSNDTALLMQESAFSSNMLGHGVSHAASHDMNISDLLANVQSSDFTGHVTENDQFEGELNAESYSYHNYDLKKDYPRTPEDPITSSENLPSKAAPPDDKIYNFDKDEYQYSNYNQEVKPENIKHEDNLKIYKYIESSRYSEHPEAKPPSNPYKSRKYVDEYRERSSSHSKRSRNSLSPKHDKYKDYSIRDYGHSMDRMFKSPEYYLSITRSSSGRSSSGSSRERRKREEEWYAKHSYSLKYGHLPYSSSSHKYPESSRRSGHYKEYSHHDKRRYEDPYHKSSERLKVRDPAYDTTKGRESSYEMTKLRESGYDIAKVRDVTYEPSRYKDSKHDIPKFREQVYESSKSRVPVYGPSKSQDFAYHDSSLDTKDRKTDREKAVYYKEVGRSVEPKSATQLHQSNTSPVISPPTSSMSGKDHPTSLDNTDSPLAGSSTPSPNDLDDLLEKAIANIPKTPEEAFVSDDDEGFDQTNKTIYDSQPISPEESSIIANAFDEFSIKESHAATPSKQALIDSILPKPKYCSILKENFAVDDNTSSIGTTNKFVQGTVFESIDHVKSLGPQDPVLVAKELLESQEILKNLSSPINSPVELKDDMSTPPSSEFDSLKHETTPHLQDESTEQCEVKRKDAIDNTQISSDVPEPSKSSVLLLHDNQDFPMPKQFSECSPRLEEQVYSIPKPVTPPPVQRPMTPPTPPAISTPVKSPVTPPPELIANVPQRPETPPPPPPPAVAPTSSSGKKIIQSVVVIPSTNTQFKNTGNGKRLSDILGGMRKPTPRSPVILTTTRMNRIRSSPIKTSKSVRDSSDAEEGEILSDPEESSATAAEEQMPGNQNIPNEHLDESNTTEEESIDVPEIGINYHEKKAGETVVPNPVAPQPIELKAFVPDENFVIRSKRDLFKARFFQPDMKIDFAKPDKVPDASEPNSNEIEKPVPKISEEAVLEPNPDNFKYSKKNRFKEVLQQHLHEQENENKKEESDKNYTKNRQEDESKKEEAEQPSSLQPIATASDHICFTSTAPAALPSETDVTAVSLLGKRKRFLIDYIAALESNPPPPPQPPQISKTEEDVTEHLPKLRIKPLSGGSYTSETMSANTSSLPPPLHKANTTSPDKDEVPLKCIIKQVGKGAWSTCDDKVPVPPPTGRGKGRPPTRRNLRSREASTDSSKSSEVAPEKTKRSTRSRKNSKKSAAAKSYVVEEDDKLSDNSFEDNEKSRKSGRTRKTIKRLNL